MDIIVDHHLQSLEPMIEADDHEQAIGTAALGMRSHSVRVCWSSDGQEQQRREQPQAEQEQRDTGDPLGQPMLAALMGRTGPRTFPIGDALSPRLMSRTPGW